MIDDIEKEFGYILPNAYKSLVVCIKDFCEINFNESPNEFPEDKGTSWFFWDEHRLQKSVTIEGCKTRPAWQQLKSFIEINQTKKNKTQPQYPEQTFCIAIDEGDLLYIDCSDNNSVWVYMCASGETKKLAASFDDWLSKATFDN